MLKTHCDFCDNVQAISFLNIDVCVNCLAKATLAYIAGDEQKAETLLKYLPDKMTNGRWKADFKKRP